MTIKHKLRAANTTWCNGEISLVYTKIAWDWKDCTCKICGDNYLMTWGKYPPGFISITKPELFMTKEEVFEKEVIIPDFEMTKEEWALYLGFKSVEEMEKSNAEDTKQSHY